MKLSEYVKSKPVVSIVTVKLFLGCDTKYASLALRRLVNRGVLRKISRNKYTASNDIHAIATNLYTPSYISFWSASQYYGYTEQILSTLYIATTKPQKEIVFENYILKFVPVPKKYFFGYSKVMTDSGFLFVAETEKLLLDAVLRPKNMGNFDEIVNIVKLADIKKEKVIGFLKKANNSSLVKRVGFLLETYKNIDISNAIIYKDKNYVVLNTFDKKAKKIVSKWRVKV